jgi:hypothetical protein
MGVGEAKWRPNLTTVPLLYKTYQLAVAKFNKSLRVAAVVLHRQYFVHRDCTSANVML